MAVSQSTTGYYAQGSIQIISEFSMSNVSPFMIMDRPCNEAQSWVARRLEQSGFRVVRTFDLQTARLSHLDCPCPHHGTDQCDCQLVVLLVYEEDSPPATVVIHGSDETSWIYLVNTMQQPMGQHLQTNIQGALKPEINTENSPVEETRNI